MQWDEQIKSRYSRGSINMAATYSPVPTFGRDGAVFFLNLPFSNKRKQKTPTKLIVGVQ
jgi:hypothetical protein